MKNKTLNTQEETERVKPVFYVNGAAFEAKVKSQKEKINELVSFVNELAEKVEKNSERNQQNYKLWMSEKNKRSVAARWKNSEKSKTE